MKKTKLLLVATLFPISLFAQEKITIMANAGMGWRTAKIPDNISSSDKDRVKKLKSGFNFDISAYHKLGYNYGLGLKFNQYNASASGPSYIIDEDNGQVYSTNISTKDRITFIGPSFLYSNFDEEGKHKLYYELALGLINYNSDNTVTISNNRVNMIAKGSSFGVAVSMGYNYQITPNILVGPQLAFTGGTLSKVKMNNVEEKLGSDEKEGLHRVSLGMGATFRF
ncbi:MAG: hypothetical protein Q4G16_12625 [Cruoricaptor ignavus]|nr:hypothetical protein [Cruoricaptor ignavus]